MVRVPFSAGLKGNQAHSFLFFWEGRYSKKKTKKMFSTELAHAFLFFPGHWLLQNSQKLSAAVIPLGEQ